MVVWTDGTLRGQRFTRGPHCADADGNGSTTARDALVHGHLENAAGEFPAENTLTLGPIGLVPAGDDFVLRVLDAAGTPVSGYTVTLRHFVEYVDFKTGVGVNGGLACEAWSAGGPTGLKASLWLNGGEVGALSVQSMYDKIAKGVEFKPEMVARGTMVTPENYRTAGLVC